MPVDPVSSRPPRIAITYPYPLGEANGGARMTREIARHLSRAGAQVVVLPVSSTPTAFPRSRVAGEVLGFELDEELSRDGVEVVRVPQHALHWLLDGLSVKRTLASVLKRHRVDIVLSYFHEAAFLPSFLKARNIRFGYISTWQSYAMALSGADQEHRFWKSLWKWSNDRSIIRPHQQADILFATSKFTRGELRNVVGVDGSRIVVCHLGVDPRFTQIPRVAPQEITRLLFFGRIVPNKGILDAIEALAQVANRGLTNWVYRVLGPGDQEWARNAAREHGIGEKVEVAGAVDDEGLRRELERAHLAIMPSHSESFGLAFAEAQAAGLPVVAYETGSVPEIVEHGVTGWLAPLHRRDRLATCIEKALLDPQATYHAGLDGRRRVQEMFTWERTATTILEGIRSVA